MSRLSTSFVLGYHGCDREIARRAVNGEISLLRSDRDHDWLGPGVYFWQSDPRRAQEWADAKVARGRYGAAGVVGAVIDLGNCLDLTTREDIEMLRTGYKSLSMLRQQANLAMPENRSARSMPGRDIPLRFLDCAVIKHVHMIIAQQPLGPSAAEPFDTVRGMFTEGGPAYPGGGFFERTHVQIAVQNDACIKGLFLPR